MYLVDTNVLSANAPTRPVPRADLAQWMDRNSHLLFLSVITVAEIEDGIAKARRAAAVRKAARLADWLDAMLHLYGERILPIDLAIGRALGRLSDRARAAGQAPGLADLSIAATAEHRGLTVLTHNLRHFQTVGVQACDPVDMLPTQGG